MVLFFKGFLPKIANFKGNSPGNGLFAKNTVVSRFLRFSRRVGDSGKVHDNPLKKRPFSVSIDVVLFVLYSFRKGERSQ